MLIETGSDKESPRKRQKTLHAEACSPSKMTILQAALMMIATVEANDTDHAVKEHFFKSFSHTGSTRSVCNTRKTTNLGNSSTGSLPESRSHSSILPRGGHDQVKRPVPFATPRSTRKPFHPSIALPSGQPLLPPPRLPHVKFGESLSRDTRRG